jgi:hypothetical protein
LSERTVDSYSARGSRLVLRKSDIACSVCSRINSEMNFMIWLDMGRSPFEAATIRRRLVKGDWEPRG